MMRKEYLLPGLALIGGGAGFALRHWQLTTAFEPDTGLPIAGLPAPMALVVFSLIMALLLALCTGRVHRIYGKEDVIFPAQGSFLYLLCLMGAGALTAMAGVGLLMFQFRGAMNPVQLILGVLCILAAFAFAALGRLHYLGRPPSSRNVLPLLPGYAACFWLMASYQGWSEDPVIADYVCFLFALVFAALAYYFIASFSFGKSPVFATCLTGFMGVYFAIVTMADSHELSDRLLLLAFLLYALPHLVLLLRSDRSPQAASDPEHPIKEDA